MEKVKIRQATVKDAEQIVEIAKSLKYDPSKEQEEGFLVYVLDYDGYRSRIKRNLYFYVAESDSQIDGFLMSYDDITLRILDGCYAMNHQAGLARFLFSKDAPFIFTDQIGVKRETNRSGIGRALMNRLFQDMRTAKIPQVYGGILHEPTRNEASIAFCTGLGFEYVQEVQNPDFYRWGVYRKLVDRGER